MAQRLSRRFNVRQGRVLSVLLLSSAALLGGCAYLTVPSDGYPATSESIRTRMAQMKADPKGIRRPVIVIDGWLPIGSADTMQRELAALTGATNGQFVKHTYLPAFSTLEGNARRIVEKVEKRWPSTDPEWTVEVDAVGYSMGGMIGRVAALDSLSGTKPRKRLQIRTLYTISTPHGGVGWWLGWLFVGDMSFNTSLYAGGSRRMLDAAQATAGYELLCYGQGNDWVAGRNTAPAGYQTMQARGTIVFSHFTSFRNDRHLADIAARLRGEAPLVEAPPQRAAGDITGTYTLISIDGNKLPYTSPHDGGAPEVLLGTFTINGDGTCSSRVVCSVPSRGDSSREGKATYTQQGAVLTMKWEGGDRTTGAIEDGAFTMNKKGMIFAYRN